MLKYTPLVLVSLVVFLISVEPIILTLCGLALLWVSDPLTVIIVCSTITTLLLINSYTKRV
jgi:hypothetical protein